MGLQRPSKHTPAPCGYDLPYPANCAHAVSRHQIILSLGFGLVSASILAMGAVGFTLQFGVTNLFNLAFGEVMTFAIFVAYLANHPGLEHVGRAGGGRGRGLVVPG